MWSTEKPHGPIERGPRPTSDLSGHFLVKSLSPSVVELSPQEEMDSAYAGYVQDLDGVYRAPEKDVNNGNSSVR
jgi:hypothetical protein